MISKIKNWWKKRNQPKVVFEEEDFVIETKDTTIVLGRDSDFQDFKINGNLITTIGDIVIVNGVEFEENK
jgi:sporulation protein YlmC with PRC-barrel domain